MNCVVIYVNCVVIYVNCVVIYVNCVVIYVSCVVIHVINTSLEIRYTFPGRGDTLLHAAVSRKTGMGDLDALTRRAASDATLYPPLSPSLSM